MKMNKVIFLLVSIFLTLDIYAQEDTSCVDTVIVLQEVSVYAKQGLSVIKPKNCNQSIHVRGKGKTSLTTRVDVNKKTSYKLDGIEFSFNYQWQGFSGEGFYIKPLILKAENGRPTSNYMDNQTLYFVSKAINEIIHIDLSEFDIEIKDVDSFFVGIEFVDTGERSKFEDFNVTMIPVKKKLNTSFIKGSCSKCTFSSFDLDEKNGLSLKYNLYYKE